jgi:hypothetical protein
MILKKWPLIKAVKFWIKRILMHLMVASWKVEHSSQLGGNFVNPIMAS